MFEGLWLAPQWLIALSFFIYGSCIGSFANVLIYRMQRPEPLNLFKKSHCPQCSNPIPFYLNIPIFSWFILRGKCRNCKKRISFRYPVVEFLMAGLFSTLFLAIGWKWFLLEALIFAFALTVASCIDGDLMILPDSLTLSGIVLGLLGAWLNPDRLFLDSVLGVISGGGFLFVIAYIYYWLRKKEGLGGGDIKMMAWIGAVLGGSSLPFVLLMACFTGSLLSGGRLLLQKSEKVGQTPFPFGPYLAFGALLYIFLKEWAEGFLLWFTPFSL